jgi:hypothetical protein
MKHFLRRPARASGTLIARFVLSVPGLLVAAGCSGADEFPRTHEVTAAAGAQGTLRSRDSVLVNNGDHWVSLSSSVPKSATGVSLCDPADPFWQGRDTLFVPFRRGVAPGQLANCYDGDAMPDGPHAWAVKAGTEPVTSPSVAKVASNLWLLAYSAVNKATSRRCIGIGASSGGPTGPAWWPATITSSGQQPDICAAAGSAFDPYFFYDRKLSATGPGTNKWYVLWRETTSAAGADSLLKIQEVDPATGRVVAGTQRNLLDSTSPALRFSQAGGTCTGTTNLRRVIGRPTMTRAQNGHLWLFFSANERDCVNYSTGRALCGTESPLTSTLCEIPSAADAGGRFRPQWGAPNRTSVPSGSNAAPYLAFPNDMAGFGGMTLALPDPKAEDVQPIYATAHSLEASVPRQSVLRLDDGSTVPGLFESELVSWYGQEFGSLDARTPSGPPLSKRVVPNFRMPAGMYSLFSQMAPDGTLFNAGVDHRQSYLRPTARNSALGAFSPKNNAFENLPVAAMNGSTEIPGVNAGSANPPPITRWAAPNLFNPAEFNFLIKKFRSDQDYLAGGALADVQVFDGGRAVAFTIPVSFPGAYWGNAQWGNWRAYKRAPDGSMPLVGGQPVLDDGVKLPTMPPTVWPAIGVARIVDNKWKVMDRWSARNLRESSPSGFAACPEISGVLPNGETLCAGPNELSVLPQSGHLVVTQYLRLHGQSLVMVLEPTRRTDGGYDMKVAAQYSLPTIPHPRTAKPIDVLPREVFADPTGVKGNASTQTPGDERFAIAADMFENPSVLLEFSYDDVNRTIRPVSAPIITGLRPKNTDTPFNDLPYAGVKTAHYDKHGNLWTTSGPLGSLPILTMYANANGRKTSKSQTLAQGGCNFNANLPPQDYKTSDPLLPGSPNPNTWGQICPPDYVFLQAQQISRVYTSLAFREHPTKPRIIGHSHWGANVLGIEYSGSGRMMSFTIAAPMDNGRKLLDLGYTDSRPGAFDATGRMWFNVGTLSAETTTMDRLDRVITKQWVGAIDTDQLFDRPAIPLAVDPGVETVIEGENTHTKTTGTRCADGSPIASCPLSQPILVDPTAFVEKVTHSSINDGPVSSLAADDAQVAHQAGIAEYVVWVPKRGNYSLSYFASGKPGAMITFSVGDGPILHTTPVETPPDTARPAADYWRQQWQTFTSSTLFLEKGRHVLRISAPTEAARGWRLDSFKLRREP